MKKVAKKTAFMLLAAFMLQLSMASATFAASTLTGGQSLYKGQMLSSADGRFALVMQNDGNLVHYNAGTSLWSTNTSGRSYIWYDSFFNRYVTRFPDKLTLTTAGVLKVSDTTEQSTFWQADTKAWTDSYYRIPMVWPGPGDTLIAQDDGNVVLYDTKSSSTWKPVWATNTGGH